MPIRDRPSGSILARFFRGVPTHLDDSAVRRPKGAAGEEPHQGGPRDRKERRSQLQAQAARRLPGRRNSSRPTASFRCGAPAELIRLTKVRILVKKQIDQRRDNSAGRNPSECVAAFLRNGWPESAECAVKGFEGFDCHVGRKKSKVFNVFTE